MRHHDTMIRVSRFVASLLAAGLLAAPATAAADGITSSGFGARRPKTWARWLRGGEPR